MISELIAHMDNGPQGCCLMDALRQIPKDPQNNQFNYVNELLGFADEYEDNKLYEFLALLDKVQNDDMLITSSIPYSVAKWVFCTNKIENMGPNTLEETEKILQSPLEHRCSQSETVLSTLGLLTKTYKKENYKNEHISAVIFDTESLKLWFSIIMPNHKPSFRKHGVEASSWNGATHKYPHHQIVEEAIKCLCSLIYTLSKGISRCYRDNENKKVLLVFALAAFAQFHFVDIHPFPDGNGRLCRLISKRILDWCCPFPFPMFENRETYFNALIEGRKGDPKSAPKLLMGLLLDSAIEHYTSSLCKRQITKSVSAQSSTQLEDILREMQVKEDEVNRLMKEFVKMQINTSTSIKINDSFSYKLTRMDNIDFDSL